MQTREKTVPKSQDISTQQEKRKRAKGRNRRGEVRRARDPISGGETSSDEERTLAVGLVKLQSRCGSESLESWGESPLQTPGRTAG